MGIIGKILIILGLFTNGLPFDPSRLISPQENFKETELYSGQNPSGPAANLPSDDPIYLPVIIQPGFDSPKINVPNLEGEEMFFSKAAIAWFGRVNEAENYADLRIGSNASELQVLISIFDRRLWYDPSPEISDLLSWDAASLYLNLDGSAGNTQDQDSYRFVGQLVWWEPRDDYQAAYQGGPNGWTQAPLSFTTVSAWRGNVPNNSTDDRGWKIHFRIPFTTLGLSGPPPDGTTWKMAVSVHDRDDAASSPNPDQNWPLGVDLAQPKTWGTLSFGIPAYTPPPVSTTGTTVLRHKLDGITVTDGMVGGKANCGSGLDFWNEWGDENYAGIDFLNVQNQSDLADWPCFSKTYLTFPLDRIPAGKVITSATLTLHLMGNAGGGEWGPSPDSLIQVLTVAQDWDEATLTWNNAPPALENVSATWVKPILDWPGWPGVPYTWDITRAASEAFSAGNPLRLAVYSADNPYNSGKYFVSSDTGDWNEAARPTLSVNWGNP